MEEDVVIRLLNDMPLNEFHALYITAMGGAFSYFMIRLLLVFSPVGGPIPKWAWSKFWIGIMKLVVTAFAMPWWILYFEDLMPIMLNFFLNFPEVEEDTVKNVLVQMNGASAVLSGFCFDWIIHRGATRFKRK